MFTGLVEACAPVVGVVRAGSGAALSIARPEQGFGDVEPGESISVSGCCLTIARLTPRELGFDLSAETLARTRFDAVVPGTPLNLERSLKLSDRLGGHLVSGHVDGVGTIVAVEDSHDGGAVIEVEVPSGLERYLIEKGSIAIDGVSLTVVAPRGRRFRVALIPVTLAVTSLGRARAGDRVHLEADLVGKWIEKLVAR